jgi:hypothetical protein
LEVLSLASTFFILRCFAQIIDKLLLRRAGSVTFIYVLHVSRNAFNNLHADLSALLAAFSLILCLAVYGFLTTKSPESTFSLPTMVA